MDYEKLYKDALERAKKALKTCGSLDCEAARLILKLFPELCESKDERIRKELIEFIQWSEDRGMTRHDFHQAKRPLEWITWLEKQKDASKAIEAVDRIDKYIDEHLVNAHDMKDSNPDKKYYRGWDDALGKMAGILQDVYSGEKQKEHQSCPDAPKEKSVGGDFYSSNKDKNLDEIAQDYVDGVKQYNQEPTWDLMQTAVCYGYHLSEEQFEKNRLANCDALSKEEYDRETDFAMEIIEKEHRHPTFNDAINYGMRLQKQKEQKPISQEDFDKAKHEALWGEQKPAEWGEEDEKMLKWLCRIIHSRVVNKELSLAEESELGKWIDDKLINHEPQHEKKWDEFDRDCLKRAIWYVDNPAPSVVKDTNLVLWLQSLPERFNLQPKEEWSEEDEEISKRIISDLRWGRRNSVSDKDIRQYDEEINWMENKLKSLRPQYHGDVTMTEAYKMGLEAGEASSWKPSEEQIGALNYAYCELFKRKNVGHNILFHLQKLIDHLREQI